MVLRSALVVLMLLAAVPDRSAADAKGVCPSPSGSSVTIPKRATPAPPAPGVHYLGAVTMVVSLSDTGYLCAVEVVKGIEEGLDKQAVDVIRKQVFQPIRQDGKPIAGSMIVQRDFWRADASNTLFSENAGATSSEISLEAKSVHALDIASVTASGRAERDSYQNQYFGVSFVAPGATVTIPAVVDHGDSARLVDAIAGPQNRDDKYTISIVVERLSNYPELRSLDEYVDHASAQLKRELAERAREDDFPYTISGVEFVGAIFKVPDGPDTSHFRAIFSTVMKGYLLSLDVTAAKEQQALTIASSIKFK